MRLQFKPWGKFRPFRDKTIDRRFLDAVAHETMDAFKIGLAAGKSGIHHPGLPRRSSAPGEFPANQMGALRSSIDSKQTSNTVTVGSRVFYAVWLAGGSRYMAPRKMSKEAMAIGIPKARSVLKGFVTWRRG